MFDPEILPNKYKQYAWNYKGVMRLLEISWPIMVHKRCIKSWIPDRKAHVKSQNIILKQTIKHHNIYLSCSNVSGVQVKLKHKLSKRIHGSVMKIYIGNIMRNFNISFSLRNSISSGALIIPVITPSPFSSRAALSWQCVLPERLCNEHLGYQLSCHKSLPTDLPFS